MLRLWLDNYQYNKNYDGGISLLEEIFDDQEEAS